MAMGTRRMRQRQEQLWYGGELPTAPGHPFYKRLNEVLDNAKFDRFCEKSCAGFYHRELGRPSLPPGQYFRIMMIGFFEGLESERGIAWRLADSLTRRLIHAATHQRIFSFVLEQLAQAGLVKGKTIGVDSTTLEANAAMKSIVRRDTGESYSKYLQRLAEAEGIDPKDAAAVQRMDRKRKKKMSNEDWQSPSDAEAEITRLKDGRTALAYKVENAVDMETGAIVAVTTHSGAAADTQTVCETVVEAGVAIAGLTAMATAGQEYEVNAQGLEEVVADKGYHGNEALVGLRDLEVRTYVAEPERGERNWEGKPAEKAAVYANRRRVAGPRGKRMQKRRGGKVERNFAHQFDTGGMDRLWVRGRDNAHKKFLLQAAACNLALLMRSLYGSGKPKAFHDRKKEEIFAVFAFMAAISAVEQLLEPQSTHHISRRPSFPQCRSRYSNHRCARK